MKEIFIILAYTPKQEQQIQLRNLVYKLKADGKKVMIMSHDHTPQDIVKEADYYFYDSDNLLVPAWKTTGNWIWHVTDATVITHFNLFGYTNYSIPYSKSLYAGLNIAKLFDYDIAHTLVYDTIIEQYDEFDSNVKDLKIKYDCVAYNFRTDESPMPIGHFMSFNLNRYSNKELKYNEVKLLGELDTTDGYMVESSSLRNLILPKKFLMKKESDIDSSKLILNLSDITPHRDKNIFACVCCDDEDFIWAFVDNRSNEEINLDFLLNNETYLPYKQLPGTYKGDPICKLDELKNVKVYFNGKLIREMDFENDIPKWLFKLRSYFKIKK
jgi:hypothetical protein